MTTTRTWRGLRIVALLLTTTVLSLTGCGEQARSEKNSQHQRVLAELSADCRSPLAQELATISIHAGNPLLEANVDLANRCGREIAHLLRSTGAAVKSERVVAPIDGLINFESPHVHPIDLTPNRQTLVAVNTAAHRLEVWRITGARLTPAGSIPVGLDPVSVRARSDTQVWVVNHMSDSVSIVDLPSQTVIRTLHTGNEPADVVFAGPNRAFVSASEANLLNVFDLDDLDAIPLRVAVEGEDPRALAVSPDGNTVYAAVFESGNGTRQTGTAYGGAGNIIRDHLIADNDVAIIDAATLTVSYRRRLMNMVMAVGVNPVSGDVHVVGTEAFNDIAGEPALNGRFIKVEVARFAGPGLDGSQISDLNPHLDYTSPHVTPAMRRLSVGDPRAIAWRADGSQAFVAAMGSNNIAVIDPAHRRVTQFAVGQGPTGIVLDDTAGLGFVMNKFEGAISVIDLQATTELSRHLFDDPTPAQIKAGRPFIYDTHLSSGTGHLSCASCHVDARTDRLGWQLSDDSNQTVIINRASNLVPGNLIGTTTVSTSKPVMVTQTLLDIMAHPNFHWRGDKPDIDSFSPTYVNLLGRDQLIGAPEMSAMKAFLQTLWLPPNPYRRIDNSRPATVQLPDGSLANSRRIANGQSDALRGGGNTNDCLSCHAGQGLATRNFGANDEIGSFIVAPALPALYDKIGFTFGRAGFGFFHHGGTSLFEASRDREFLAEILTLEGPGGPLSGAEIRQAPHAGTGQQVTITADARAADLNRLDRLISIATTSPWAELVAHTRITGLQRGFVLRGDQRFDSDMPGITMSRAELLALADDGNPVTFMLVAHGMATRLALDRDLDGILNQELTDSDADGTPDRLDAFPHDPVEQLDSDGDGIGNHADTDDDNDGVPDSRDRAPLDAGIGAGATACNLLTDPGFETGHGTWQGNAGKALTIPAHSGANSLGFSDGYLGQLVPASPGVRYEFSGFSLSHGTGWAGYGIDVVDRAGNAIGEAVRSLDPSAGFTAFSVQIKAPPGAQWLRPWFYSTAGRSVKVDDLDLRIAGCAGTANPETHESVALERLVADSELLDDSEPLGRCNRLVNGSFDSDMTGWKASGVMHPVSPPSGTGRAVRFEGGWISTRMTGPADGMLTASGLYRFGHRDDSARVGFDFLDETGIEIGEQVSTLAPATEHTGFVLSALPPAGTDTVRLWFHATPGSQLTLDTLSLREPGCN